MNEDFKYKVGDKHLPIFTHSEENVVSSIMAIVTKAIYPEETRALYATDGRDLPGLHVNVTCPVMVDRERHLLITVTMNRKVVARAALITKVTHNSMATECVQKEFFI